MHLEAVQVSTALAGGGNEVCWRMARDRLQSTMPQFTQDEHFLDLFRFTIDLGANKSAFMSDLCAFHTAFVDPQLRKVRTSTFALCSRIDTAHEWDGDRAGSATASAIDPCVATVALLLQQC